MDARLSKSKEIELREAAKKAEGLEVVSRRMDIEWLVKQPQFMRYVKRVLSSGGIMNSVMTGNSQTFYKSGRQDFTREIWAEIAQHDQEKAMQLLKPKEE